MFPNFKDIIKAVALAGFVLGAAAGFASKAEAGPLDQGPHILVAVAFLDGEVRTAPIDIFADKQDCLAARDNLLKLAGDALDPRIELACIPGRNT